MASFENINPPNPSFQRGVEAKAFARAIFDVIPKASDMVIPRSESDEESYLKDFSLPLEMTGWADFERLFELLSTKKP